MEAGLDSGDPQREAKLDLLQELVHANKAVRQHMTASGDSGSIKKIKSVGTKQDATPEPVPVEQES